MSSSQPEEKPQEEGCAPSKCATCPMRSGCSTAGGQTGPDPGVLFLY